MTDSGSGPVDQVQVEVIWPARVRPLPFSTLSEGALLYGHQLRLMGWALLETTGSAAAEIEFFNGGNTSSDSIGPVSLSSGQSTRDWFGPEGIECDAGLYANVSTGSVRGTVWIKVPR